MTTVLICDTYGGWGLSREALHRLRALGSEHALAETDEGECWPNSDKVREASSLTSYLSDIPRDDPLLLQVFEEMGQNAAGRFCHIAVVVVPDDVAWHIEEYDGNEHVAEDHRTWS